ncbi:hypothetical protein KKA14_07695, partial [bacterium]|nr:hypothetical protein [bacterium]
CIASFSFTHSALRLHENDGMLGISCDSSVMARRPSGKIVYATLQFRKKLLLRNQIMTIFASFPGAKWSGHTSTI